MDTITFKLIRLFLLLLVSSVGIYAQAPLIANIAARKTTNLNGNWQYIIDPYETGYFDYRYKERLPNDRDAYWNSDIALNKSDKIEHGYNEKYTLKVPGDWNSQSAKFLYYEGTVWYKKTFDINNSQLTNNKIFIHFGAVNYRADVYVNGHKLGMHLGGFTPFNFEVDPSFLKPTNNWLVVKVDNKRYKDEVPTLNTDWWNYGGITRDVNLLFLPQNYIQDYTFQLVKATSNSTVKTIEGWIKLNTVSNKKLQIHIPDLDIHYNVTEKTDSIHFKMDAVGLQLWKPTHPTLYEISISLDEDIVKDKIGFRTIEVLGNDVLLNNKKIMLRGICIHEEMPVGVRRAVSYKDALHLLGQAKQLNANMVRLAHYPHNENMVRVADSLGLFVWSEIPVYWTIDFSSASVLKKAVTQLNEMVTRDKNRASIIIWSVGNETPVNETRTNFMQVLVKTVKTLDSTRLVAAALENFGINGEQKVEDPLGAFTDIIAVNEYIGWYGGLPDNCRKVKWSTRYNKPFFISETGAEAVGKLYGDSTTRWTEEFQEWYYKEQVAMLKRMPSNFLGVSPWILNDFRSPRRNNPITQQGWNNKGLFDQKGRKKKAFFIIQSWYKELEKLDN